MFSGFKKWAGRAYWALLALLVVASLTGTFLLRMSDDVRVTKTIRSITAYNVNWVYAQRSNDEPDKTFIVVKTPGTDDEAHRRIVAYQTADLVGLDRETLKKRIQSDSEAAMAGLPVSGTLREMTDRQYQVLKETVVTDWIFYSVSMLAVTECIALFIALGITFLRNIVSGRKRKFMTFYTYWTRGVCLVFFASTFTAICAISYPLMPVLKNVIGL